MQYNDFGTWLRKRFPDFRVQKISIDAGFTCPNRDGRISTGGCTFCDNRTFNPSYCDRRKSIHEQLREGKRFFNRKYSDMKYLAYFQAFTNTYGSLDSLRRMYEEALAEEDVVGLVIGTRPDCISAPLLDYLEELSRQTFLIVEYGIESANDATLRRINRGHTFECSRKAVEMTAERFSDSLAEVTQMEKELVGGMRSMLGIGVKVHLVAPKSIERSEGKAVRVIDKRKI